MQSLYSASKNSTKSLALLYVALFSTSCAQGVAGDADASISLQDSSPLADGNTAADAEGNTVDATPMPVAITLQASDLNTIVPANSIVCGSANIHRENQYLRTYALASAGITGAFSVNTVHVGIESATSTNPTQPIVVAIHTLSGALTLGNLTEVASVNVDVIPQTETILDVPIVGEIPANQTLVVSVLTPNGLADNNGFFMGSNRGGEDTPSFLVGPDCGNTEPTAPATLVPGSIMSIVLNVSGTHLP